MKQEVSELTLLIYISIINHKDLGQVLSEYTGCEREIYTEKVLTELVQSALADISRCYHIPTLLTNYFRIQKEYELLGFSELGKLQTTMHWIPIKVWSKEDTEIIKRLRKEYIEVLKNE